MLTRLLVGLACWGSDELRQRLRAWEEPSPSAECVSSRAEQEGVSPEVTPRALLIGLAFEGPERLSLALADLRERGSRLGAGFLRVARPVLRSRLGAPVVLRIEAVRARVEAQARELAEVGRIEEIRSRVLAQRSVQKVVEGVFDQLAEASQVRELIVEQGSSMAGELMDALQERSELADGRVERFVRAIFRRRAPPRGEDRGQQEQAPTSFTFPTRPVPAHM